MHNIINNITNNPSVDAVLALDYGKMVLYRDDLQRLSYSQQLALFYTALIGASYLDIKYSMIIIDAYCPLIEEALAYLAVLANKSDLFTILCEDYINL